MKRLVLLAVLFSAMPLATMAQDDLYFTPSKSKAEKQAQAQERKCDERPTYYCGSNRNVDEYNRRGKLSSYYQKIGSDSLGNDIIQFHAGNGEYPDSVALDTIYPGSERYYSYGGSDDDFAYSRRMNRFDNDYGWYDPYFYDDLAWDYPYYYYGRGFYPYWRSGWGYPYYGWGWGGYYGLGWGGYYGWADPWYWDGWGYPYYGWGWGPGYAWRGGHTGTYGHSFDRGSNNNGGVVSGNRQFGHFGNGSRSWGNSRATSTTSGSWGNSTVKRENGGWRGSQQYNPSNRSYNDNRSYTPSYNNTTRSVSSPSSFGGSRSFGGSGHSFGGGGGFSGGGRSFGGGGGGHFGGGRR